MKRILFILAGIFLSSNLYSFDIGNQAWGIEFSKYYVFNSTGWVVWTEENRDEILATDGGTTTIKDKDFYDATPDPWDVAIMTTSLTAQGVNVQIEIKDGLYRLKYVHKNDFLRQKVIKIPEIKEKFKKPKKVKE